MIKEMIPNVRVSNDARELILNCCTGGYRSSNSFTQDWTYLHELSPKVMFILLNSLRDKVAMKSFLTLKIVNGIKKIFLYFKKFLLWNFGKTPSSW